jgi:hypothetical protein
MVERQTKQGDLQATSMKHMTEAVVQGLINDLGDLGKYCMVGPTHGGGSEGRELRIVCTDKDGDQRIIDLSVRSLGTALAEANNILPSMRFATFKIGGFNKSSTRDRAHAVINYLSPILKVDPDHPAVRAFGRGEHVNAIHVALLVTAILKAMLKYVDPATRERRRRSASRWDARAAGPVVVNAGDGFADEVEKKAKLAQLERVAKRMWVMTEFKFGGWRPPTPEKVKKDAWRNQEHADGTVGCWYEEHVACNEEVKAACRVNCRGRFAHLTRKEVQFAHLWAIWHQLHSGLWGKVSKRC